MSREVQATCYVDCMPGGTGIDQPPIPAVAYFKPELAAWLAKVRGPQSAPIKVKLRPRPTGDSELRTLNGGRKLLSFDVSVDGPKGKDPIAHVAYFPQGDGDLQEIEARRRDAQLGVSCCAPRLPGKSAVTSALRSRTLPRRSGDA
jgi:hypothetical protein